MKRFGNLFDKIVCPDNLRLAFANASRGRGRRSDVVEFAAELEDNLAQLQRELSIGTYRTSQYTTFTLYEPKERVIYRLPFRDRVVHWAIMLVIEPIWVSVFTRDTYACIRGRGIHPLLKKLRMDMASDVAGTGYCLKIDVKKFYPSIDHGVIKKVIRMKIKDRRLLALLDEIVDSTDTGVPIGNYLSQFFANLYLAELDHILKERHRVKHYYRYADDIVILAQSKGELHNLLTFMKDYLSSERHLCIKGNYQIFPVTSRGVDFVGYVTYHTHCLARKVNKKNLCRQVAALRKRGFSERAIRIKAASRLGFMAHCNSSHLLKSINMKTFSEIASAQGKFTGEKYHIDLILNREIHLKDFEITQSKYKGECLTIQYDIHEQMKERDGQPLVDQDGSPLMGWVEHISFTGSEALIKQLRDVVLDEPCAAKIVKQQIGNKDRHFYKMVDPDK